ncbi:hypothetical protein [Devosia sp. Root105]|uniref:hypothetical protein n=1 Tax=Devosia sp. Root105 TaxID=1736423 RepID=UPI000A72E735|nr:hypothetical protein [Devosia sp. Root105]
MKLLRLLAIAGMMGVAGVALAADLGASAANQDGALGYSLAELRAALPNIPEDQLPSIVFRIPTIHSIMAAYRKAHPVDTDQSEDSDANSVN